VPGSTDFPLYIGRNGNDTFLLLDERDPGVLSVVLLHVCEPGVLGVELVVKVVGGVAALDVLWIIAMNSGVRGRGART